MEEQIPEEVNTETSGLPTWIVAAHVLMSLFILLIGIGLGIQFGVGIGIASSGVACGVYGFILGRD